ncbi:hypothetical protein F2Q70_00020334 [Brassica cretica]|uniref:Uncharacterized protein n=1 Tax=Brassica cretica TaxID=69181 RepID=A0A8S9HIK8_BRACR|nr:hypothetical protein F2Q70_00020334 [Brassica cretica]KAF2558265.1 hypothetical protein F2Q68_00013891 [Brassica cretica]
MFFRETRETEEDIRRMFCEVREKMKNMITLKKKSDPGQFAIPCGAFQGIIHFCGLFSEELRRNCERPRGADCRSSVQLTNQSVVPDTHRSLMIQDSSQHATVELSTRQNTRRRSKLTQPHRSTVPTRNRPTHPKKNRSTVVQKIGRTTTTTPLWQHTGHTMHTEEYDEDYEEERATEYRAILDEEDRLLHHSSWKRNAPSIDRTVSISIDTHPHQTSRKRASTDIAYYPSIDTEVDSVREGDYSIGSWEDDHHHESYAVETEIHEPGVDEPHEGFTYEELLNMERRDEADQQRAEATGERTRFSHSIDRANRPSIDVKSPSSIDIRPKPSSTVSKNPNYDNQYLTQNEFSIFRDPYGYARAIDGHALQVSIEDIADILQMANGADNLFMQQYTVPAHQQRVTKEFYDTAGGIDNHFKQKYRHPTRSSIDVDVPPSIDRHPEFGRRAFDLFGTRKLYWEEKDEYVVYRDDKGCARDVDGHIINVSKDDIRKLMESASRDEHIYICLPEHASSFTQTKLVPEIYTKDEINEMFYGHKFVDYMHGGDEARHSKNSFDKHRPASIDRHYSTSIDDDPKYSHRMKFLPYFHTREEIDQLVEDIYRTLETTEDRLDKRCDDIYFPMDLTMNALTSKIEAIQRELVEIQSYIACRPEASASIDRRNNKSTDIRRQTSVDEAPNRGRLVPKVTSDVSDTHNHGEEISADTYATLRRHQFNLESLGDRSQKMENTTATMKERWRIGDETMRDFTGTWFNKRREEMNTCFPASSSFPHY